MHRSLPVQLSESSSLADEALHNRALDLRPSSSATTIPSRLTERQRAFFHSTCSGLSTSAAIRSALALILLGSDSMVDGVALALGEERQHHRRDLDRPAQPGDREMGIGNIDSAQVAFLGASRKGV